MTGLTPNDLKRASAAIEEVTGHRPAVPEKTKPKVIQQLITAKGESDRKNYRAKHHILRTLLRDHPEQFTVSPDNKGLVSVKHNSGFRLHLPASVIPTP
jgi:hypothetical protein